MVNTRLGFLVLGRLILLTLLMPSDTVTALSCDHQEKCTQTIDTDRTWKNRLLYPEKYYKQDLLSGSTTGGVGEVVEDFSAGRVGTWEAYYRLQQARLDQWLNKPCEDFVDIPLPEIRLQELNNAISSIPELQEMVTDRGDRWLLVLRYSKLDIWNITGLPKIVERISISNLFQRVIFVTQENVLMSDDQNLYDVHKFAYPDYKFKLMYQFSYYEDKATAPGDPSLQTHAQRRHRQSTSVVVDDVFIACDKDFNIHDATAELYLHVWKLSSGEKIAKVQLQDDIIKLFLTFLESSVTDKKEMSSLTGQVELFSVSDDLSKILIVLHCDKGSQINIFSVKTLKVTRVAAQVPYQVNMCHMYADKVCVTRVMNDTEAAIFTLSTDSLTHPQGQLLRTLVTFEGSPIQFKNSKIILPNNNSVSIFNLDGDSLQEIRVNVSNNFNFMSFIEPNLLMIFRLQRWSDGPTMVKVINTRDNSTLCSWKNPDIFFWVPPRNSYYRNLIYPTKISLQFREKLRLLIP